MVSAHWGDLIFAIELLIVIAVVFFLVRAFVRRRAH